MFSVNDTLLFKSKLVTRSVAVAIAEAHLYQIEHPVNVSPAINHRQINLTVGLHTGTVSTE